MNLIITGHRKHKLENYDVPWIQAAMDQLVHELHRKNGYIQAYSGMASGIDLWFCMTCQNEELEIPYIACIPFEEQAETMSEDDARLRQSLIDCAAVVMKVKNSWMVEKADMAIVVWDGNKGGTHNVLQQLIERKKPFYWINPVAKTVYDCTALTW